MAQTKKIANELSEKKWADVLSVTDRTDDYIEVTTHVDVEVFNVEDLMNFMSDHNMKLKYIIMTPGSLQFVEA